MKKNLKNSEHYKWGTDCNGWHLLKSHSLSVIEELMPPNTSEVKHYHSMAQQFFYILKGEAVFELKNGIVRVLEREGIHIAPKSVHQIRNEGKVDLEFLVISEPTSRGDRIEII
ncbi:MAG TPA: cupin domain-containing protein [Muricauda sp.]|nr:cupin domain-containing protein [uncultured Allomuricauda sp.]MBC72985.1 cupin [Allomuricauda sp.]HBU78826.1 cupin domain-containing protein [Allomuricauda sp.]|tara:strand:- start:717 stop:1058 length:342 start_codon:yes stop_codon:yes gene_type:complete